MLLLTQIPTLPLEDSRLQWEARQVLRDRRGEPHMFLRIRLKGGLFPRRGVAPFAQIGAVRSAFVEISRDEESAYAYFDRPLTDGAAVEFGYGREVLLRFGRRFCNADLGRLDRRVIPPGTRNVDRFFGGAVDDAA